MRAVFAHLSALKAMDRSIGHQVLLTVDLLLAIPEMHWVTFGLLGEMLAYAADRRLPEHAVRERSSEVVREGEARESGEPLPIPAEVGAEMAREGEDDMPGDRLQDLLTYELAECNLPLSLAGRTEAALIIREGEEIFVTAPRAADSGETPGSNGAGDYGT
jgi:hypothetical protein